MECCSWRACPHQKSSCFIKEAQSYGGAKIAFSFFLSIYSRCYAPASWAARHTTVCLDTMGKSALPDIYAQARGPQTQGRVCIYRQSTSAHGITNLIQNSQAVKKVCGPQKGYGEKRCEIQGGGQEMAVMVG